MLSLYSSELFRRSTWTCLSCSTLSRISQAPIAGPPNRSSANAHQRRHSSSKTPSPPKNETRAITTPTDTPTKENKPVEEHMPVEEERIEKRPSTRISRRKSKVGTQDTGKSSNEMIFNLPSVPKTNHLHAGGIVSHPLRLINAWLTRPRRPYVSLLLLAQARISHNSYTARIFHRCVLLDLRLETKSESQIG